MQSCILIPFIQEIEILKFFIHILHFFPFGKGSVPPFEPTRGVASLGMKCTQKRPGGGGLRENTESI